MTVHPGTRTYFDETVLLKATPTKTMLEKNSNGAVLQTIAQTPGSIGYVSIGFVSKDVKALPIWYNFDKIVAPTLSNVKSKTYPISRDLYVITNGSRPALPGDFMARRPRRGPVRQARPAPPWPGSEARVRAAGGLKGEPPPPATGRRTPGSPPTPRRPRAA